MENGRLSKQCRRSTIAPLIAKWIDWLGGNRDVPDNSGPIAFLTFTYADRPLLALAQASMPFKSPFLYFEALHGHPFWREQWEHYVVGPSTPFFAFAMEQSAAAAFLNAFTCLIRSGQRRLPEALDLPTGDLAGIRITASIHWIGASEYQGTWRVVRYQQCDRFRHHVPRHAPPTPPNGSCPLD